MPNRPGNPKRDRFPPSGAGVPASGDPISQPVPKPRPNQTDQASTASAFELWLERGLHRLYDDVAQEPIPEALLKIIEQDRDRK